MNTKTKIVFVRILAVVALTVVGCSDNRPTGNPPVRKHAIEPKSDSTGNPPVNLSDPGVTVTTPVVKELRFALSQAGQMQDRESGEFQAVLRNLGTQLANVPVATDGKDLRWTKVQLNSSGAGFDAIRFTSPLDQPADLVWAFALPQTKFSWYISPANGKMIGFRDFRTINDVAIDGVELPPDNILVMQRLEFAQILPQKEYFLYFTLGHAVPLDCYVKVKLVPAQTRTINNTYPELAQELSIPMPFKFTSAVNLNEHVTYLIQNGLGKDALSRVEAEMKKPPVSRSIRWLHAAVAHDYAFQLVQAGKTEEAKPLFLQAASEMRKIKQDFGELTNIENEFVSRVFYNECCTLALSGKPDLAVKALRESADSGWRDWQHTMQDEDLASLQSMPEFKAVIDQMKAAFSGQVQPQLPRRNPAASSTN